MIANNGASETSQGEQAGEIPSASSFPIHGTALAGWRRTRSTEESNPKLAQMFNKVKGGNYHGYYNAHYHRHRVDSIVRRGRRLLLV